MTILLQLKNKLNGRLSLLTNFNDKKIRRQLIYSTVIESLHALTMTRVFEYQKIWTVNSHRSSVSLTQLQVKSPRKSRIDKNKKVNSLRKSTQIDDGQKVEDDTLNLKAASVKRKLALYNPPNEDEDMGENEIVVRLNLLYALSIVKYIWY